MSFTACAAKCYSYLLDNGDGTVTSKVTFKGFSSEPTTMPIADIERDLETPSSKPSYNAIANFVMGNNCTITETREGLKKSKLDLKVVSSSIKKSVKNFRTNRTFESINISKPSNNTDEIPINIFGRLVSIQKGQGSNPYDPQTCIPSR